MSNSPWTLVGQHANVRFSVSAEAGPGLLARLVQPFARRDLVPDRFEATRSDGVIRVEIAMTDMPAEMVHLVTGNLGQVVGVQSVACRQEITGSVRRAA